MTDAVSGGWFDRVSERCATAVDRADGLDWRSLLRLAELLFVIGLVLATRDFYRQPRTTGILLGICVAAWLWWLACRWSVMRGRSARGPVVLRGAARTQSFVALLIIAMTSGAAVARPGAAAAIALTLIAALAAGTELSLSAAAMVCAAAVISLESGAAAGSASTRLSLAMAPVVAVLFGRARRERQEQLHQARALNEQTNLTKTEQQRAGALAERARIAREIHDVLAHSLGALAIQLELAEVLLTEDHDISQAAARIRQSRELTDEGLTETRRAVRALRADTPPLPEALAGLAAARRADDRPPVEFTAVGAPRQLTAEINLALLRTAQEALVNAGKHVPDHAVRIRLAYTSEETRLTVSDFPVPGAPHAGRAPTAPHGVGGGYGLAGMRERLALAGGSLDAGPSGDGWTVTARVSA